MRPQAKSPGRSATASRGTPGRETPEVNDFLVGDITCSQLEKKLGRHPVYTPREQLVTIHTGEIQKIQCINPQAPHK